MTTRVAEDEDLNLRPLKRLRIDSYSPQNNSSSSSRGGTLTPPTSVSPPPNLRADARSIWPDEGKAESRLARIPSALILLNIPGLIVHPPSHRSHAKTLSLARHALKQCLTLELEPVVECRAWTGLAELGLMWLGITGGEGLGEVEQAITKALVISQKHPALQLYTPHLNILSARLAQQYQANAKFAANAIRRVVSSLTRSSLTPTPPYILFSAHLALVHSYASAAEEECSQDRHAYKEKGKTKEREDHLKKCLGALRDMLSQAKMLHAANMDDEAEGVNLVVLLVLVIRLQLLVRHGMWSQVNQALEEAEKAFEAYECDERPSRPGSPSPTRASQGPHVLTDKPSTCRHPIPPPLKIHLLILSVLFHTYVGNATLASERLRILHELLDTGVLNIDGKGWNEAQDGVIEIHFPIPNARPLRVLSTPPRVLHSLAFLVSAVAKRDPVGRAPKKGVFAKAGLALKDFEVERCFGGPEWLYGGSANDKRRLEIRMERIRADLMAEVVSISIMRSEFAAAADALDALVAHTRNNDLFPIYAPRIALQHAQLLHARGDTAQALQCYQVVAFIAGQGAERDDWIRTAARAGEIWIRVGIMRAALAGRDDVAAEPAREWEKEVKELRTLGKEVMEECEGLGGTLMAAGGMLEACLTEEFVAAKLHLRQALDLATRSQDNHLRAVILALVSAHYQHTARDHATAMLGTCSQLAAGLGAVKKDSGNATANGGVSKSTDGKVEAGNLELRLWAGERMLELHRWSGEVAMIKRQEYVNARVKEALQARVR